MNRVPPVFEFLNGLRSLRDSQQRMARLVAWGKTMPSLSGDDRSEDARVAGCVAQLWFVAGMRNGLCEFRCDSDSAVVRAVAGLLCAVHTELDPAAVLALEGDPLADAGIQHHLSTNRRLGLGRMRERIRAYAQAQLPP